ncbi:hypothetical protein EYF80_012875 [Liparis tanakae]|uniref:Uncharacterized protein n=1 Tax=Liparis tanakae TaxID=230148 RepID=A0A4Z2IHM3_9TELE|nr:hypothetical protein EYF80_012875 [Liparis tanakae]
MRRVCVGEMHSPCPLLGEKLRNVYIGTRPPTAAPVAICASAPADSSFVLQQLTGQQVLQWLSHPELDILVTELRFEKCPEGSQAIWKSHMNETSEHDGQTEEGVQKAGGLKTECRLVALSAWSPPAEHLVWRTVYTPLTVNSREMAAKYEA